MPRITGAHRRRAAAPGHRRSRWPVTVTAALAVAVPVTGCTPAAPVVPGTGALGAEFLGGVTSPSPEATITPAPDSWTGVRPPAGYDVVVISADGDEAATATIVAGVRDWADRAGAHLLALTATGDDEVEDRLDQALATDPDLVVGAGTGIVDVFALLTGQHLDDQFLVVGAELAEPTHNVTSVVWPGATFRGTGLGAAGEQAPDSVTPERVRDALDAGTASVLAELTGIVIDIR